MWEGRKETKKKGCGKRGGLEGTEENEEQEKKKNMTSIQAEEDDQEVDKRCGKEETATKNKKGSGKREDN